MRRPQSFSLKNGRKQAEEQDQPEYGKCERDEYREPKKKSFQTKRSAVRAYPRRRACLLVEGVGGILKVFDVEEPDQETSDGEYDVYKQERELQQVHHGVVGEGIGNVLAEQKPDDDHDRKEYGRGELEGP